MLPARVARLAGADAVDWLAVTTLTGALAASIAGVGFGALSDRVGTRRGWVAGGLCAAAVALPLTGLATTLPALVGLVILWQAALNAMLAPLAAWAADRVPGDAAGRLGGRLALAPAIAALAGVVVTLAAPRLSDPVVGTTGSGLAAAGIVPHLVIAVLVALLVAPLLLLPPDPRPPVPAPPAARSARGAMWIARLLVQIAEAALFAYLLLWLRGLDAGVSDRAVALLLGAITAAAVPLALHLGRRIDARAGVPFRTIGPRVLAALALGSSAGLIAMAIVSGLRLAAAPAMVAYALFGIASAAFLSLHAGQTLRVLARAAHRGRDLGLFNLANTIPSLVAPVAALLLVRDGRFGGLFLLLAALCAFAALIVAKRASDGLQSHHFVRKPRK